MRFVGALVRFGPIGMALTVLTAADLGLPSNEFWDDKHWFLYVCLGLAFVSPLVLEIVQARGFAAEAQAVSAFEGTVHAAMCATLEKGSLRLSIPIDQLAIHAFLISGRWRKRLVNIGCLRIRVRPSMHRPRWVVGKGVVGRSWKNGNFVIAEWGDFAKDWIGRGKSAWEGRTDDERYLLSWMELNATRDYTTIAARPICRLSANGSIIGCVAIDGPFANTTTNRAILQEIL